MPSSSPQAGLISRRVLIVEGERFIAGDNAQLLERTRADLVGPASRQDAIAPGCQVREIFDADAAAAALRNASAEPSAATWKYSTPAQVPCVRSLEGQSLT